MPTAEKHAFQAEIGQLLEIVTHSLYTDKEIFVRELISNAADASEKLKFLQTSGAAIHQPELPLQITVTTDDQARTITIADAGLGMSRTELVENLGTIAHSGSRAFLERVKANQGDANLIGQFGVGFYSAFIVADHVTLITRRAGAAREHGVRWESSGEGDYTVETVDREARGTDVILHLRPDEDDLLSGARLRAIVRKYSDHITVPIVMQQESWDAEQKKTVAAGEDEQREPSRPRK